jgi:hypothetical protein
MNTLGKRVKDDQQLRLTIELVMMGDFLTAAVYILHIFHSLFFT